MKLPKEQLESLQKAKNEYDKFKADLAHAVIDETAAIAHKKRQEALFSGAFEKFKAAQGEIVRKHGEGISIDFSTGEITKPK